SPSHRGAVGPPGWICHRRRTRRWRSAAASSISSPHSSWVERWSVVVSSSEVPVLLSVFHGSGRDPVVGTCGSAFGHGGGGDLGDDRINVGRLGLDGARARHIADGAVAHSTADHGLVLTRGGELAGGPPHAVAVEDLAFVGEVELRQGDILPGDVAPHIEFGEVRDREHAHVLTGQVAAVVDVPQLGALAAGVPAAEFVAQGDDPLLRPGLVLIPAGPTEDRVEAAGGDGVDERLGLERVAGAVGAFAQATVVDVVLDLRHREGEAEAFGGLVTEAKALG